MASGKEYLESLGLEIAKRKYYNAAKVESVIEELRRSAEALEEEKSSLEKKRAALEEENAALRARADSLACGRLEIGEAILSAKMISQQLIAEAREQAEAILAEAREKAEGLVGAAGTEADGRLAACEERERQSLQAAQEWYLRMRGQCLDAVGLLDGEWQRFLCSFGAEGPEEEALPEDLPDKLGALAACLADIEDEDNEAER